MGGDRLCVQTKDSDMQKQNAGTVSNVVKKKRREWRIRNYEQLKETPHAVFFTGTVSPQRYEYICKKYGLKNDGSQDNEIITKIHRLFLERIRKETSIS